MLARLIYTSERSESSSPKDYLEILKTSMKNNEQFGVTGILCYNHAYYLQCLEGGRAEINKLYHSIVNDNRHKSIFGY